MAQYLLNPAERYITISIDKKWLEGAYDLEVRAESNPRFQVFFARLLSR